MEGPIHRNSHTVDSLGSLHVTTLTLSLIPSLEHFFSAQNVMKWDVQGEFLAQKHYALR